MSNQTLNRARALKISEKDNVATTISKLAEGDVVDVLLNDEIVAAIVAREAIPLAHKMALSHIAAGEDVLKYGESIGRASADIPAGYHVHVHNIKSRRGSNE